jgi:ABC-type cobalamin/Fe3+-siderophores transport system ATPase subunit
MRLLEIEIKNLKSITNAKLTFPTRQGHQVSLLYGDNGAGKTTVLEAISLLGHVSTMRRICTHGKSVPTDTKHSRFRQFKGEQTSNPHTDLRESAQHEKYDENAFAEQCSLIADSGLDDWWAKTPISGDPYRPARIKYSVRFQNQPLTFYISFLQGRDLSITEALSRDQNVPGEKIHDGNMDNWFAIVYQSVDRESVEALVDHMLRISPHSYYNASNSYQTDPRATSRAEGHSMVGYWNTDLNDFGRKNDLRESVKKIRIDFKAQMIDRLGIALPYGSSDPPLYHAMADGAVLGDKLEVLNSSLKRAIVDHAVAMQRESKKLDEGLIRIVEIDPTKTPAVMKARRIGADKDVEIDHLSAGENESVFIFLLMHGMPCKDSIILLDEPDLHLSDFAKSRFYRELYQVAAAERCQLIISTHSAFAYTEAGHGSHHFIRRVEENDGDVIYRTEWDNMFGELLTFYYARCVVNAMSAAGFTWRWLSYPLLWTVKFGEHMGLQSWSLLMLLIASISTYSALATLNDMFLWFHPDPVLHRQIIGFAFAFCLIGFLFLFSLRFLSQWMGPKR